MGKLILVSNRLPMKIGPDGTVERTTGGLASAMEGATGESNQWWVGWPGGAIEDMQDPAKIRLSMRENGLDPVFLTKDEVDGFYEGYSNATLWPLLHYMVDRARFSPDWWKTYQQVNRKFADQILALAEPGDRVWIHDYHLMLTPQMIRNEVRNLKVGFFLHTPFCSSEIFRALPHRSEILKGLLGADLIGFHTFNYLRHFRSSLLRILGWESEMESIWLDDRKVRMGVYPIGHNHAAIERAISAPDFVTEREKIRTDLAGKRMILNVERLDYTKGLPEKLAAMRRFLERYPDRRNEVLFVLIAVPSRQGVKEYDDLTEEVQREVGAINGEFGNFGHMPVQFLHRSFPMEQLAAFYALSEICMVTPLRDGMNLVAKEFLDCQRPSANTRPGVLILSEFAGATNELSHAIHVNPHDTDEVASAIDRALDMDDSERLQRIEFMQARLRENDNVAWAKRFLSDLENVNTNLGAVIISDLQPITDQLTHALAKQQQVGIFLDYDGTLRDFVDVPEKATPDAGLVHILRDLASVPGLSLAVVSGRKSSFLEHHFGNMGITLVGEHGYRWFDPQSNEWQLLNPHVDVEWKANLLPHLLEASRLTPGTHVEEKQSALVFHYRKADPEFGLWRASSLLEELTSMAANLPVTVHHGKKIVEISSLQVNKGVAVDFLLRTWNCQSVLCAGDDQTDETMLSLRPENTNFHSIKVGSGPTRAAYRTDIPGLRRFLESFHSSLFHT